MKHFYGYISGLALVTIMLTLILGLYSCVDENGNCSDPVAGDDGKIFLRFTIMTRSDDAPLLNSNNTFMSKAPDIEGDIEGSGLENKLNLDDLHYFLFDEDRGFLQDFTPKSTTIAESDNYKLYQVVANIDDEYIEKNITGTVSFYIMALANYSDWGVNLPTLTRGTTIEEFLQLASNVVMTSMPNPRKLLRSDDYWHLYPGGAYFHMAGLQKFDVPGNMLTVSSVQNPYDISFATGKDLNMLRSLVKIEVIDKINVNGIYQESVDGIYFHDGTTEDPAGKNSWLRVDKVEINGVMSQGTLVPSISEWTNGDADETQQVNAPTIPLSAKYNAPPELYDNNEFGDGYNGDALIDFMPDRYATELRADKCPVFSGYVFEYSKLAEQLKDIPSTMQPYIRITTRGYTDFSGQVLAESMILPLRIAKYKDGISSASDNLDYLLRNHIYRFELFGISQDIQINWTVCDMTTGKEANIEFN